MQKTAAVPMRRPPASAKSEQRIRDILRVARQVFSEAGFQAATTTEIAQRLGVSEGTVFTYFAVSYTHLDVYKRQACSSCSRCGGGGSSIELVQSTTALA